MKKQTKKNPATRTARNNDTATAKRPAHTKAQTVEETETQDKRDVLSFGWIDIAPNRPPVPFEIAHRFTFLCHYFLSAFGGGVPLEVDTLIIGLRASRRVKLDSLCGCVYWEALCGWAVYFEELAADTSITPDRMERVVERAVGCVEKFKTRFPAIFATPYSNGLMLPVEKSEQLAFLGAYSIDLQDELHAIFGVLHTPGAGNPADRANGGTKGKRTRGKTIPVDVKNAVAAWLDRERGGDVKGEGWNAAYDAFLTSPDCSARIRYFVGSAPAFKRVAEAARKARARKAAAQKRRRVSGRGQIK